jgi:hypothetical protein
LERNARFDTQGRVAPPRRARLGDREYGDLLGTAAEERELREIDHEFATETRLITLEKTSRGPSS